MAAPGTGLLKDRVVVLAGYGAGLGTALAQRSVEEGARLVIASRTQAKLEAAAEELRAAGAEAVLPVATDIDDPDACQALVDRTLLASPLASAVTGVCLDVSCGEFHR